MKSIFFLTLLLSFNVLSQSESELIDSLSVECCSCLQNVVENERESVDFGLKYSGCLEIYLDAVLEAAPTRLTTKYDYNDLIHTELKNNCETFDYIDSVHNYFVTNPLPFEVDNPKDCHILKKGIFLNLNANDSILVHMDGKKQIVKFKKDGTETTSKVEWIDDCTYELTFIKSTNQFEAKMRKKGQTTKIRIIQINGNEITYELESGGRYYSGKLLKLE